MSEIKVDKISPESGTAFTIGDSGDTFTVPSGATIVNSGTATGFGGGGLLQIKQTVKSDTFSGTATTATDITGLTVDITPTLATSKILVMPSTAFACTNNYTMFLYLVRDSTTIFLGDAEGSNRLRVWSGSTIHNTRIVESPTAIYIDAPATTSATTYKVQYSMESGGTGMINRDFQDTDTDITPRMASSITVIELAEGVL